MANFDSIRKLSGDIKSIADFESFRCDKDNNVFVRIIGEDNSLLNDISNMDNHLRNRMAYRRLRQLDRAIQPEAVSYYNRCYEEWLRSFRKKAVIKSTQNNGEHAEKLGTALSETLEAFKKIRTKLPQSMERNFIVKLLFWYDEFVGGLVNENYKESGLKIVGENISKVQDYLFFYMIVMSGGSVLLIQNKTDILPEAKNLGLSNGHIIGHFGNTDIPEYTRIFTSSERTPSGQSFISSDRTSYGNDQQQNSPSIRVVIPPHPKRKIPQPIYGNGIAQQQSSPTVRMTIPPHPNRQTIQTPRNQSIPPIVNNPVQARQNPRMTIPSPHNGSFHGNGYRDGQTRILGTAPNQPRREKSFEELAQLASSVVQIFVMHKKQYQMNGQNMEIDSSGSGVMIGENGYVVTNFHVVEGGQVFGVRIENDEQIYFTDQIIKYHRDFDLAILRIDRKLSPLPVYNDPKGLVRGQKVVAIGSPHGLFNTVSDGIISGFRNFEGVDMIQFTAPVSPGSSGGAVLNMYGEVVGIARMIRNNAQNINLAVGYDLILNFCRGFI